MCSRHQPLNGADSRPLRGVYRALVEHDDGTITYEGTFPKESPMNEQTATYARSWKPQVEVEGKWSDNHLRFPTKEEAERWASDLLLRWFVPTDSRAVESTEYPNYRLEADGSTTRLCSEGGCGLPARSDSDLCRGHHRMAVGDPDAEIAPNN